MAISPEFEDIENFLRKHNAGAFVEAVKAAKLAHAEVMASFLDFGDEPDVLYAALQYGYMRQVAIRMLPEAAPRADGE